MLKIFDTLQKDIIPLEFSGETVNFYSCGPTVYGYAHIGNLRSFIMADVLFRTLKANGQKVRWVMNITDIDDKTIRGCLAEFGNESSIKTLKTYTTKFTERFIADLREVGVNTEQIEFINVTDVIPEIQEFIMKLKEKGYAYTAEDGSTYFSIEKYQNDFKDYGALVGAKFLEGKKVGARIKHDEYDKDNLSDFALWKAWDEADGAIFWEHPELGKGRPGWHIECSAINFHAFRGEATDIHTGGIDLIFPHHTNEIAQSQPLGPFVNYWVHFEHLLVDSKKMSKSLKNDYTLEELKGKGFSGLDLRYLLLQSNFRQQNNFTWEAIEAAHNARVKLANSVDVNSAEEVSIAGEFLDALNNNLNTAGALAIAHQNKDNLLSYDQVLGLSLGDKPHVEIPEAVQELLTQRQQARDNKDFSKSDELRDEIAKHGFEVKDTSTGQQITKK
ncbi:class I tRNA ligase family protein [bacterium]|nr:MAG: class I tRNA ligase family protein [bacterium]